MNKISKKVIVAMSGGVDSSVAALMLQKKYKTVVGVFLHFWKDESDMDAENKCCSTAAMMDARNICQKIGIPFYTMNFYDEFKTSIVDYFLDEYKNGRTPNPCVACNKFVELGGLIKRAREMGFDYVASGHYAKLSQKGREFELRKAKDANKDQTYFLSDLGQAELKQLLFPLGNYTKDKVREYAAKAGLKVAAKKDSSEICFVSGKSHNDFLKKYLKLIPGDIVDSNGKVLGKHEGLPLYTLGQRKGVEIGGTGPYYAVRMDYEKNILYVSNKLDDKELYRQNFVVKKINWADNKKLKGDLKCEVVIRYRHKPVKCFVSPLDKGGWGICLSEPQRAITPGQQAVFYKGSKLLGGGIIE